MTAVEFGRGNVKEAERAWRGINIVDQQMYLKDAYLKDQLKWPPRVRCGSLSWTRVDLHGGIPRARSQEEKEQGRIVQKLDWYHRFEANES